MKGGKNFRENNTGALIYLQCINWKIQLDFQLLTIKDSTIFPFREFFYI